MLNNGGERQQDNSLYKRRGKVMRGMVILISMWVISGWVVVGQAAAQTVDPAGNGSYQVGIQTVSIRNSNTGNNMDTDIYFPSQSAGLDNTGSPYPVVVMLHGFQYNKTGLKSFAQQLSSWGFICVLPTIKYGLLTNNAPERQSDVISVIDYLVVQNGVTNSVLAGGDMGKIGITGHSAGGLTAMMVTAADKRIKTLFGLDAVLSSGMPGSQKLAWDPVNASTISVPLLLLVGPPQSCNAQQDNGKNIYPYAGSKVKARYEVINASHCDFMDEVAGCSSTCGTSNDARRSLAKKYLTAWMNYSLGGRQEFETYIFGGQKDRDVQAGLIKVWEYQLPVTSPTSGLKPGDGDGDGNVNGRDYVIWLENYGKQHNLGPEGGDFDNDTWVNGKDYVIWLTNYGH